MDDACSHACAWSATTSKTARVSEGNGIARAARGGGCANLTGGRRHSDAVQIRREVDEVVAVVAVEAPLREGDGVQHDAPGLALRTRHHPEPRKAVLTGWVRTPHAWHALFQRRAGGFACTPGRVRVCCEVGRRLWAAVLCAER